MDDGPTDAHYAFAAKVCGFDPREAHGSDDSPNCDPNAGQPNQSIDPNAGQPNQSIDPNAGQPNQSIDPSAGQPNQSVDPNAGQPNQSVDPNAGQPNQSVDPSAGQPNQSVDPNAGQPDQSVDPNADTTAQPADSSAQLLGQQSGNPRPKFDGVTTYSMTSKLMLAKAGYRFTRKDGSFDVWTKVDQSSFIWVQIPSSGPSDPNGGSGPNPASPPPSPVPNPSIKEARDWANDLEARFTELFNEAIKLKALKSPAGTYPKGPFNDYFNKLDRFDNDVESVLNHEAQPWLDSAVSDEERQAIQAEIDRIKKIQPHEPEMDLQ